MSDATSKPKKREVKDERGNSYVLKHSIGEGGQGVVCVTDHKNTLVKICKRPKSDRESWMENIRWLMLQDLEGLHIAKPVARIVKPQPGYVMELMDGLQSLQVLMESTEVALHDHDVQKYLDQGGIRRRVMLMAKLARILASLHGRGMAFGDLSPANVFISESSEYSEVWLIDCDNISVNQRASFDVAPGSAPSVYTPFYGAPEIVRGEAMINSLTDSWSFAVIAYRLLTAIHPFMGDVVNEGEPELEDDALKGKLPWVDHPSDDTNHASFGLPRELVLLKPLADLFDQCFNAGRDCPEYRPSLSEWAEKLEHACEWLVDCNSCGSSYFYKPVSKKLACGFCDEAAKSDTLLYLKYYLYDQSILDISGAVKSDCWVDTGMRQVLNRGSTVAIRTSPPGSSFHHNAKSLYQIDFSESGINIVPVGKTELQIRVGKSRLQKFSQSFHLDISTRQGGNIYVLVANGADVHDACVFKW